MEGRTTAADGPIELNALSAFWARAQPMLTSTWTLGVLVAVAVWNVGFATPYPGLDPSWWAGLYMAAHRGLDFGTQIIWTYGPLGFLRQPWAFYGDLAVLSFLYGAAVLIALCLSLVWALRRSFNAAIAVPLTFVVLVALPSIYATVALPVVWCLAALSERPPPYARRIVIFGGAIFAATECLVRLSSGPTILLMCAATLLALRSRWRDLALFAGTAFVVFIALWFGAGQGIGNLPDYVHAATQIVSGYSQAMGVDNAAGWYVPVAIATMVLLVFWTALSAPAGAHRVAAGIVVALASFIVYKEAVVRFGGEHLAIFFATATVLVLAIPWQRDMRWIAAIALVVVGGLGLNTVPSTTNQDFNPISHIKSFVSEVRNLASPARRAALTDYGRSVSEGIYKLDSKTLALLQRHTVDIDPWEAGVAWAYGLDWKPVPIFQGYQAYTSDLDHDNANELASSQGPERVLRENEPKVWLEYPTSAVDGRNPAWDPPAEKVAMLCHYTPLSTTSRWQVLGKTPDRCGSQRLLRSVRTANGANVLVPKAAAGEAVIAKVKGIGVSGLETLKSLFFRANFRYATVNGNATYRLVPGTAGDGLIMNVPRSADFPGSGFSLSPGARTLSLTGASGNLTIDFYAMPITKDIGALRGGPRKG